MPVHFIQRLILAGTVILSLHNATITAQEALWGGTSVVSPTIMDDNSVIFQLAAPTASVVKVTGDFIPKQTVNTPQGQFEIAGTIDMIKDSTGVWSVKTGPLSPEIYSYTFIVDGFSSTDPSNVHLVRDVSTTSNIFIVPGERSKLYAVNDVPHGAVSKIWYRSDSLGISRRMTIYTPPGYESSARYYPVLYLLHGMGGDEDSWSTLGRATQILDNLIADGKAQPMIVVMPNGNPAQQAAPGQSSDGLIKPTIELSHTMDGTFEEIFSEIVNFVDRTYRTEANKSGRAIAGLSMGGFNSMNISRYYSGMFDYVGMFSAAINPLAPTDSPVMRDIDAQLAAQFSNPPQLYWIAIGTNDFLYDANKQYRAKLDADGYPYTYFETSDGHVWKNWRIYLTEFAPKLFHSK